MFDHRDAETPLSIHKPRKVVMKISSFAFEFLQKRFDSLAHCCVMNDIQVFPADWLRLHIFTYLGSVSSASI